jgi:hypothetical protein
MPINFTVKTFALTNTRSVHEDTNYVALGISHNGTILPPQTKKIGNVNNGTHAVNMEVSVPSTYTANDTFAFSYLVINHGGGGTQDVLNDCASAMTNTQLITFNAAQAVIVPVGNFQLPKSLSTTLRAKDNMNTLWNLVKAQFQHLSTDRCDGPVAIDCFSFTGAALTDMILVSQANPFSIIYLGIDSAVGCGSNSDYSVQWLVSVS